MDFRIDPIHVNLTREVIKKPEIQQQHIPAEHHSELIKKYHLPHLVMSKVEYKYLMGNRPLLKYRPIRNSFVKRGDKALLAEGLGIQISEVDKYIDKIIDNIIANVDETEFPKIPLNCTLNEATEQLLLEEGVDPKIVEPYIYRHGRKDQVLNWLKYELSDVKAVLQNLYRTLEEDSGGLYDYFARPCHLMDNQSLTKMNNTIVKSLDAAEKSGYVSKTENTEACLWAIQQIEKIQSNSLISRAVKFVYNNS